LQARHRKLLGKVGQHGVGEAEVALPVLKVDGVDLRRRGRVMV
jgi:hypothetical protein